MSHLIRCLWLLLQLLEALCNGHSLYYNFTVMPWTRPAQPWCKVQGLVDGKPFLYYDSISSKARPLGDIGMKVNATKAWEEQTQVLKDLGKELRLLLADIKQENHMITDSPTLQVKLICQQEADQYTGASWNFSINGQLFLLIDTMNANWTAGHPGARSIKEKWQDRELAEYFKKISQGDCNYWLREFLVFWKNMLEQKAPLSTVPTTFQLSNTSVPSYMVPTTVHLTYISIIATVLVFIIFGAFMYWNKKSCGYKGGESYHNVRNSTNNLGFHYCIISESNEMKPLSNHMVSISSNFFTKNVNL